MTRRRVAGLLSAFNAASGLVELQDGDLRLTGRPEMLSDLRAVRFDLLDIVDGQPCALCGRPLDRRSAPGRVFTLDLGEASRVPR